MAKCNLARQNKPWLENLEWAMDHFAEDGFYQSLACFSFGAVCHIIFHHVQTLLETEGYNKAGDYTLQSLSDFAVLYSESSGLFSARSWEVSSVAESLSIAAVF